MFGITTRRQLLGNGLTALAGLAAATACGTAGSGGSDTATRTVEHAMGTAEVPREPRRVVTLDDTFTSAALALDTPIVGYTTVEANAAGGPPELPGYLGADARTLGSDAQWVGTLSEPNMEKIALLRPDLILSAKVRHGRLHDQLSRIAPTVFSETTGATWKQNLRLTGRALGNERLAEHVLRNYRQRARTLGRAIRSQTRSGDERGPTISLVRFAGESTVRLYTPNSFPGIVCADAGLNRPPNQPTDEGIAVNLSQERIRELDADHIFVSVYADPSGAAERIRSDFRSNPLWERLHGRQHEVDDTTWMTAVGPHGAHRILTDLAAVFGVDPAR